MAWTFQLRLWLDRFQPRERLLMLISLVLVVGFLFQAGIWLSGLTHQDTLEQRIETLRKEFTANQNALIALQEAMNNPLARNLSEQNRALQDQLQELDNRISRVTDVLIPPDRMVTLLRELLNENGLTLQRLDVKPAARVQSSEGDPGVILYRHRLELDLQGNYTALMQYLDAIEAKPWQLFWDEISIETKNYPQLNIRLRVHTLSDQEEWLNV